MCLMMDVTDFIARSFARKMCELKFICPEQEDDYKYSIQVILEKVIGYFVLLLLSVLNHLFLQTILFLLFFSNLRKYTGGYHARSFLGCIGLSMMMYEVYVIFLYPLMMNLKCLNFYLLGLSLIVVLILGTVNHPDMHLDEIEYSLCKNTARRVAAIEVILLWRLKLDKLYSFLGEFLLSY